MKIKYEESVQIIIVNWNTLSYLKDCLSSIFDLLDKFNISIVVVDNGSTDGSQDYLIGLGDKIRLISNKSNFGFSRAVNQAICSSNDFIYHLLLNSDAQLNHESLEMMIQALNEEPTYAGVNPALINDYGVLQYGGAGYGPGWIHSFIALFSVNNFFRISGGLFLNQNSYVTITNKCEVSWLAFACTLIRAKAFSEIGNLSEEFFVYGEDSDWCWRGIKHGWKFGYLPYVKVLHHVGGSSEDKGHIKSDWFLNLNYTIMRHGSNIDYLLFLIFGVFAYGLRYLYNYIIYLTFNDYHKKLLALKFLSLSLICKRLLINDTLVIKQ